MLERHGSLESCRSVGARADVGAWPRVCACPSRGRCRAKVGGGPCYARRGPPRPTAPRFARSGSTLKRGIYRGDSFCLRSCPLPFARTVLPLSLRGRGHRVRRGALLRSRDEENGGSKPRIEPDPEIRLFRFRGNIIYTIRSNKKNPTPNSPPARSWSLHRVSSSNILIPRSEFRVFILDAITIIQISMIYTRSPTVS